MYRDSTLSSRDFTRGFNENQAILYHRIIKLEARKLSGVDNLEEGKLYSLKNINYCVSLSELKNLANSMENGEKYLDDLLRNKAVIEVSEGCYRTFHMDLLLRTSDVRFYPGSTKMVLTTKFGIKFIPIGTSMDRCILPGRGGENLSKDLYVELEKLLGNGVDLFLETIERYFKHRGSRGYDPYQARALLKALREWRRKCCVIIAPTGAGKTEIFLSILLIKIILDIMSNIKSKYIIVYPRKFLEVNQMRRIIQLVESLNEVLRLRGINRKIKIYLRDGDTNELTLRFRRGEEQINFRGIECSLKGELIIKRYKDLPIVICPEEGKVYDFIIPIKSKEAKEADIIVTNLHTLLYRLTDLDDMDIDARDLLNTSLIIFDEIHEYDSLELANIRYLYLILSEVKRRFYSLKDEGVKIIISSATLARPLEFAKELTNLSDEDIVDLSFSGNERLSGQRALITLFIQINPRYSWVTYLSEWSALMLLIYKAYTKESYSFKPQALVFINNIRELNRTKESILNTLNLGSPLDNLCLRRYTCEAYNPCAHRFIYTHLLKISPNLERDIKEIIGKYRKIGKLEEATLKDLLTGLIKIVFSRIPLNERRVIYKELTDGKLALVLATNSLELGVDYPNVSVVVNVGFEKEESIIQRIGRGGRSLSTLNTVLAVMVARNNPLDYRIYSDVRRMSTIASADTSRLSKKSVSYMLDSLRGLAALRLAIIYNIVSQYSNDACRLFHATKPVRSQKDIIDLINCLVSAISNPDFKELASSINLLSAEEISKLKEELEELIKYYGSGIHSLFNDIFEGITALSALKSKLSNFISRIEDIKDLAKEFECLNYGNLSDDLEKVAGLAHELANLIDELSIVAYELEASYIVGTDVDNELNRLEEVLRKVSEKSLEIETIKIAPKILSRLNNKCMDLSIDLRESIQSKIREFRESMNEVVMFSDILFSLINLVNKVREVRKQYSWI